MKLLIKCIILKKNFFFFSLFQIQWEGIKYSDEKKNTKLIFLIYIKIIIIN
ncbi:hypothetical protein DDB_G0285727 [Dictyostelium discoideum AX4]|uniref:hypothetical protein n=1 Tax=Dictyostelium discoideum AX4 TaxID=352472 RepID=UPI00004E38AF|nr:hypothetical protein DDB_G0285727 [Dictyostelium discoideum AX4]EAL64701.1 hypothetical protein DDB_G0285727 [Dictyostelium discoideum AX4]|eukprot:XP_638155.1 hypothetical protein DDB_G0285727 [Dictyostelium discoideum AX4]